MSRLLAVGIIDLSDRAIGFLQKNRVFTLQELMIQRDLGLLTLDRYDENCLQELLTVCKKTDAFNEGLRTDFALGPVRKNERPIREDTALAPVRKAEHPGPTSVRKAILAIMSKFPRREFTLKEIRAILRRRYNGTVSTRTNTIRSTLSSLTSQGCIERLEDLDHYRFIKNETVDTPRRVYLSENKLESFIYKNVGKEIEFRYKTDRPGSDKRWRRTKVCGQNEQYMYTDDRYPSGRDVRYLKEKIVEFREVR